MVELKKLIVFLPGIVSSHDATWGPLITADSISGRDAAAAPNWFDSHGSVDGKKAEIFCIGEMK